MFKRALVFILIILILQGCNGMSQKEEEEIVQKAKHSARAYFIEEVGWDVVITEHEFTDRENGTVVFLYGHQEGNKKNRIHAMVDFSKDYEVGAIGYDSSK
jgi:protein involved in sex pheromone biosynthesis